MLKLVCSLIPFFIYTNFHINFVALGKHNLFLRTTVLQCYVLLYPKHVSRIILIRGPFLYDVFLLWGNPFVIP